MLVVPVELMGSLADVAPAENANSEWFFVFNALNKRVIKLLRQERRIINVIFVVQKMIRLAERSFLERKGVTQPGFKTVLLVDGYAGCRREEYSRLPVSMHLVFVPAMRTLRATQATSGHIT
jgi:hypothetical protein